MTAPLDPMAEAVRLATEMAAQASLGHRRFCVGVHEDGENEWCDWSDAFARLAALARPTLDPMAEAVDGAYEAFRERVTWFYRNAPECQEARKHSFGRQADVAFTLALREAAALARPSEDTRRVDWLQSEEDRVGRIASIVVKVNHDRDGSEWANISGDVRAAIDAAINAGAGQ